MIPNKYVGRWVSRSGNKNDFLDIRTDGWKWNWDSSWSNMGKDWWTLDGSWEHHNKMYLGWNAGLLFVLLKLGPSGPFLLP